MREHEVPTHVQAEDKVLLWFTFPQVVAMTAVGALAYGAYRYMPVGPSEARLALAVVVGVLGLALIVGRVGGRRLPLAAADLLKFGLGPRRFAGPPAELARSEPPPRPAKEPGPLQLLARRARRGLRRLRKKQRKESERRNGRMPLRPRWLGGRRQPPDQGNGHGNGHQAPIRQTEHKKTRRAVLAAAIAAAVLAVGVAAAPQAALADGHWLDEGEFEPPPPVPGRRLFVEALEVSGDRAKVTLRAATDLDVWAVAHGGPRGGELRFWGAATAYEGGRVFYDLPLSGDAPSLTFAWQDSLNQVGAFTLQGERLPYPLPSAEGELCDVRVASLGWTPGRIEGVLASNCAAAIEEPMPLQTVAGHESITVTAVMDAGVTAITGTVRVSASDGTETSRTQAKFVPGGDTRFALFVKHGEAVHGVAIEAEMQGALRVPLPPLVRLTHRPERTERRTETVSLVRPGTSRQVSETVTVHHDDGTTTQHRISARLSIPSETVQQDVTLDIVHEEHVRAEVVQRAPAARSRRETAALALSVGADAPFQVLDLPEPEPEPVPADQSPLSEGEADHLFGGLGWERPR